MISPHTPPGTKIVAIITMHPFGNHIKAGDLFTVREIELDPYLNAFGVRLNEIILPIHEEADREFLFNLASFKPAALPLCLTELLNTVDLKELV